MSDLLNKNPNFNFEDGEILLFDKPLEWSSFDVVKKVRNSIRLKKIGHAGTLDPLASGLMILCTGKMTKKIQEFQDMEKEYHGELVLGNTTPSYDLETEVENKCDTCNLTEEMLLKATKVFEGKIIQIPPVFSAIKVNGERLYKKARRGEEVALQGREVFIKEFKLENIDIPKVTFKVVCSKGTYIRSLVHDFGQNLGVGAYLSKLIRVRIGDFHLDKAYQINDFVKIVKGN